MNKIIINNPGCAYRVGEEASEMEGLGEGSWLSRTAEGSSIQIL